MFPQINIEIGQFQFMGTGFAQAMKVAMTAAIRKASRAFLLEANKIPIKTGFLRGAFGTLEALVGYVEAGKVIPPTNLRIKKAILLNKLGNIAPRWQRRKQHEDSLPAGQKRAGATKLLAKEDRQIKRDKAKLKELKHVTPVVRHMDKTFAEGEYYYISRVGRKGLKKGVHRGGAILKTTSSGQQFATPSDQIIVPVFNTLSWKFTYWVHIDYYGPNEVRYGWHTWQAAIAAFKKTYMEEILKVPQIFLYLVLGTANIPGQGVVRIKDIVLPATDTVFQ